MPRCRTTSSCLLLGPLVVWACSLSVLTASIDARTTPVSLQAFPSDPVWSIGLDAAPLGSPVASGDRLFLPLQSGISARRLTDGAEIWNVKIELEGTLATSGDYVIVPTKAEVRTLHAATGEDVWRLPLGPLTAPPFPSGDALILATAEHLASYSLASGVQNWARAVGPVGQRPAVSDGRLFVPISDGRLLVLELTSGEPVWEAEIGLNPTEPLVHGDRVFVGTAAKRFYCLVLATGREAWTWRVPATVVGPAVTDGTRVYFTALDNLLYAVDRRSGNQRWKKDLSYRPSAGPTLVGTTVSVPGQFPRIQSFDAATGAAGSPLVLAETLVFAPAIVTGGDKGPTLMASLSGNLKNVWKLTLTGPPPPAPPTLPVNPVTVLPGVSVPLPPRPVLPG